MPISLTRLAVAITIGWIVGSLIHSAQQAYLEEHKLNKDNKE